MAAFWQEASRIRSNCRLLLSFQVHVCSLSISSIRGAGEFNMICLRLGHSLGCVLLLDRVTVSYNQKHRLLLLFFFFALFAPLVKKQNKNLGRVCLLDPGPGMVLSFDFPAPQSPEVSSTLGQGLLCRSYHPSLHFTPSLQGVNTVCCSQDLDWTSRKEMDSSLQPPVQAIFHWVIGSWLRYEWCDILSCILLLFFVSPLLFFSGERGRWQGQISSFWILDHIIPSKFQALPLTRRRSHFGRT